MKKNGDITYSRIENNQLGFIGSERDWNFQFEDIYKEMTRLMDFYRYSLHQGQQQVSKVLVNGDHPLLPMIIKEIERRLEIPVETISYSETLQKIIHCHERHYLALGLALKGG